MSEDDKKAWYAPPELAGTLTVKPMTCAHIKELEELAYSLQWKVTPHKCPTCERVKGKRK
jgi:hypothetical protein